MTTEDDFEPRTATTVDGTTLGIHEISGEGALIVALHGFTGSSLDMLPLLIAARAGRPCVSIDVVGHGRSDAPDHLETYSMASVVDQVLSIVGPQAPTSVHLIGYSMGGRIALSLGARAPWYFASITTLSATAGIEDPVDRAERHDADLSLADRIEEIGVDAFVDEWLSKPLFESYVSTLDPAQRTETVMRRRANTTRGLANSLRATGTGAMPPTWNMLASLRTPLLAIAGERDAPYREVANRLASEAYDGHAHVISDAGHVVHCEKPVEVSHIVSNFLQSCELPLDQQGEPA